MFTAPGLLIVLDAAIILMSIGFALGHKFATNVTSVAAVLLVIINGYLWSHHTTSSAGIVTMIWAILLVGILYSKPSFVKPAYEPEKHIL